MKPLLRQQLGINPLEKLNVSIIFLAILLVI